MSFALPVDSEQRSATVPLVRGKPRSAKSRRSIRLAALRAPLVVKLVGANLVVIAFLLAIWLSDARGRLPVLVAALVLAVAIHVVLVLVALRPIRDLEAVAKRVWTGDFGARVERSNV